LKTETFLPRDTIYIFRTPASSGAPLGGIHAAAGDLSRARALIDADPAREQHAAQQRVLGTCLVALAA
jgi:hypothetical protein